MTQNKTEKVTSNTALEGSTISKIEYKRSIQEQTRLSLCKQGWFVDHHFVPNLVRELSVSSKTMFLKIANNLGHSLWRTKNAKVEINK